MRYVLALTECRHSTTHNNIVYQYNVVSSLGRWIQGLAAFPPLRVLLCDVSARPLDAWLARPQAPPPSPSPSPAGGAGSPLAAVAALQHVVRELLLRLPPLPLPPLLPSATAQAASAELQAAPIQSASPSSSSSLPSPPSPAGSDGQQLHRVPICLLRHMLCAMKHLHDPALQDATTLLLLLLYDADCKYQCTLQLMDLYGDIIRHMLDSDLRLQQGGGGAVPGSVHGLLTTLDRLTVQLFNSEEVTVRLVTQEGLLQASRRGGP